MQKQNTNKSNQSASNASKASGTSFFGLNKNSSKVNTMNAGMKKDRDNFKKKLQQLERKLKEEEGQNQKALNMRRGEFVEYGNEIQLLHVDSQCYMQATKQCADEDNSCNKVELSSHGSKAVYFKALGGFKYK